MQAIMGDDKKAGIKPALKRHQKRRRMPHYLNIEVKNRGDVRSCPRGHDRYGKADADNFMAAARRHLWT